MIADVADVVTAEINAVIDVRAMMAASAAVLIAALYTVASAAAHVGADAAAVADVRAPTVTVSACIKAMFTVTVTITALCIFVFATAGAAAAAAAAAAVTHTMRTSIVRRADPADPKRPQTDTTSRPPARHPRGRFREGIIRRPTFRSG